MTFQLQRPTDKLMPAPQAFRVGHDPTPDGIVVVE